MDFTGNINQMSTYDLICFLTIQLITNDAPDLTKEYPNGILSIKVGYEAGEWHAGTKPNDETQNMAHLDQGRSYRDPSAMGLNASVKCLIKVTGNNQTKKQSVTFFPSHACNL